MLVALVILLSSAPCAFSIIFALPHKIGKVINLFTKPQIRIFSAAVFFFYEEQLLWLLETFSPSCPAPAISLYLQQAAARVEELPLLDINHQRSEEVSCITCYHLVSSRSKSSEEIWEAPFRHGHQLQCLMKVDRFSCS